MSRRRPAGARLAWVAVLLVLTVAAKPLLAATTLWKISRGDSFLYLGGTFHALAPDAYPLPPAFEQAYRRADQIVLEADRGATMTRSARNRLLKLVVYPNGKTLKDVVRPDTWQTLLGHLDSVGMPASRIERFKPGMVMVMLPAFNDRAAGLVEGVDGHFVHRARRDGKSVGALETLLSQMRFFSSFGRDNPDDVILHAIRESFRSSQHLREATLAWRRGDTAWMVEHLLAGWQSDPAVYRGLVADRNRAWLPKIESMLSGEGVELVLVGVLHLIGRDSLITTLTRKGYRVEQQ